MAKKQNEKESDNKKRIIMMIIVIIIIILSLLSSCSCTAGLWGKIGGIFKGEGEHSIKPGTDDKEIVENKDLKFDTDKVEINIEDEKTLITFSYVNIKPKKFTCTTSDASIATCYVKDDYVVVNAKKEGTVTVTLSTDTNDKTYTATTKVIISKKIDTRYLSLSSYSGTIDLNKTKTKNISYYLYRIKGTPTVKSSDEKIASATIKNGVIEITAKDKGKAVITVSIKYNGVLYEKNYNLTVTKGSTDSSNNKPIVIPPVNKVKSSDTTLSKIGGLGVTFERYTRKYYYEVDNSISKITLSPVVNNKKAKIISTKVNGVEKSLKNISLTAGKNTTIEIKVKAENGSLGIYKITIYRKLNSNADLKTLTVTPGFLKPTWNPDTLSYNVGLKSSEDTITIDANPLKGTSKVKINGVDGTHLKIDNLPKGTTEVSVEVTAEDGTIKTYVIIVNRANNDLSSLRLNEIDLDVDKTTNNTKVSFDSYNVKLEAVREDSVNTNIIYKVNGTIVTDIDNISLEDGDNVIEVIVSQKEDSTDSKTYTINVYKPVRKITTVCEHIDAYLEDEETEIEYSILEDNEITTDYDVNDLVVKFGDDQIFDGTIRKEKGKIILVPNKTMVGKTINVIVEYPKSKTSINVEVTFKIETYFVKPYVDRYDLALTKESDNRTITLDANFFKNEVRTQIINDGTKTGIRIISDRLKNTYVDIYTNDVDLIQSIESLYKSGDSLRTLPIKITGKDEGTATIKGQMTILGDRVPEKDFSIELVIIKKFTVILDAKDGLFNELTKKYEFLISNEEEIDLTKYDTPYIVEEECKKYEFLYYSYIEDSVETKYYIDENKNHIVKDVVKDMTLYAIYDTVLVDRIESKKKKLYITDIDLFVNEDYYNKYNEKKVIHPGATGSYIEDITNETDEVIKIKSITLDERNICITEGCLNMGYMVKYRDENGVEGVLLGKDALKTEFVILNDGHSSGKKTIVFPGDGLTITPGSTARVLFAWSWPYEKGSNREEIHKNDILDTLIGNEAAKGNDIYKLYISLDFVTENNECAKEETGD